MTAETHAPSRLGTTAVLIAVVCWGTGNVLVKYIRLSGPALAFDRMLLGSFVYGGLLFATGGSLTRQKLRAAAPGGIAFGIDVVLFFTAVKHTSVTDASVITALQPALIFIVAGPIFGERVGTRILSWTGVAIGGVVLAVAGSASSSGRSLGGDLTAAVSLVAWAWYFVASKQARQELTAVEYQASMTIVATAVIFPFAIVSPSGLVPRDAATAGWVFAMVCIPGGGHLLINWAHGHVPISLASTLTLGIPLVAAVGARVFLGEPLTLLQLAGIAISIGALAVVVQGRAVALSRDRARGRPASDPGTPRSR